MTKTLRRLIDDPSMTDGCVNGLRQMLSGKADQFEIVAVGRKPVPVQPESFNSLRRERDALKAEIDRLTPKSAGCDDRFKKAYATIAKVIQVGDVTRSDIVATTGWSEATVRRRLNEMLASGQVVARGYPARHWLAETYSGEMVDPEDGDDMTVEVFRVRVRNVAAQKVTDARAMLLDCNDVPNNLSDREWRLATYLADHWYLFTDPLKSAMDVAFDSREAADLFEREWHGYAT